MASEDIQVSQDRQGLCTFMITGKARLCKLKITAGETKFCHIHKAGATRYVWHIKDSESDSSDFDELSEDESSSDESSDSSDKTSDTATVICSEDESSSSSSDSSEEEVLDL
jgi:hypothetical protein